MFAQYGYTSPGRRPPSRASAQRTPTAWPEPDRITMILAYLPGFVKGVKEVKDLTGLDVNLNLIHFSVAYAKYSYCGLWPQPKQGFFAGQEEFWD